MATLLPKKLPESRFLVHSSYINIPIQQVLFLIDLNLHVPVMEGQHRPRRTACYLGYSCHGNHTTTTNSLKTPKRPFWDHLCLVYFACFLGNAMVVFVMGTRTLVRSMQKTLMKTLIHWLMLLGDICVCRVPLKAKCIGKRLFLLSVEF